MPVTIVETGSFAVNCSIVTVADNLCAIIDPGQDAERIIEVCATANLAPEAILLTHGHFDHIGAIPALVKRFPGLPVYMHSLDMVMFGHPMNAYPPDYPSIAKPTDLRDLMTYSRCETIHTPGHTPGSVCLRFGNLLFSGDTLFRGSCGRTDFPGGDMSAMNESLSRLAKLPPELRVIPGHGPETTIGREVAENPFMVIDQM